MTKTIYVAAKGILLTIILTLILGVVYLLTKNTFALLTSLRSRRYAGE